MQGVGRYSVLATRGRRVPIVRRKAGAAAIRLLHVVGTLLLFVSQQASVPQECIRLSFYEPRTIY